MGAAAGVKDSGSIDDFFGQTRCDVTRVAHTTTSVDRVETPVEAPCECLICGGDRTRLRLRKNEFSILECVRCEFQFVYPIPSEKELKAFYQNGDYFHSHDAFGYSDYESKKEFFLDVFRGYLADLRQQVRVGRLLDMGCGNGDFLMLARQQNWEVFGVEISEAARAEARLRAGAEVYSSLSELRGLEGTFDAITMWEFLEHLPAPLETMRRALSFLKPGGLVALSTPNTRNLASRRSPELWREYKPPEHLQYFDFETLRRFLADRGHLEIIEMKGIHRDLRLASAPWVESVLGWASRLRGRHDTRGDWRWWIYAGLVRALKDAPRRLGLMLHSYDPQFVYTGIFAMARKRGT